MMHGNKRIAPIIRTFAKRELPVNFSAPCLSWRSGLTRDFIIFQRFWGMAKFLCERGVRIEESLIS
jgi:hypothetical protein